MPGKKVCELQWRHWMLAFREQERRKDITARGQESRGSGVVLRPGCGLFVRFVRRRGREVTRTVRTAAVLGTARLDRACRLTLNLQLWFCVFHLRFSFSFVYPTLTG
jgi:hypothetical protein